MNRRAHTGSHSSTNWYDEWTVNWWTSWDRTPAQRDRGAEEPIYAQRTRVESSVFCALCTLCAPSCAHLLSPLCFPFLRPGPLCLLLVVITNLVAAKLCIAIAYSHYKMHVKDHVVKMIKNRKDSYMLAFDILSSSKDSIDTVSAYAWLMVFVRSTAFTPICSKRKDRSAKQFHIASALFSMVDKNCVGHIDRGAFAKLCTLATQKMKRIGHGEGFCYDHKKRARAAIDYAYATQIQERTLRVPIVELVFDGLAIWLCVQVALVGTQDPVQYWAVAVGQALVFCFFVEVSVFVVGGGRWRDGFLVRTRVVVYPVPLWRHE